MTGAEAAGPDGPIIVLMCGVAGSGKTTYAQRLEVQGYVRLSIDEELWRRFGRYGIDYDPADYTRLGAAAEEVVRQRLLVLIGRGREVVLDLTSCSAPAATGTSSS